MTVPPHTLGAMSDDAGDYGPPATRPRRRARRGIGVAAAMGLVLFAALAALGATGAAFAVSTYSQLARDLPDPSLLERIELPEQSIVYDRTEKVELARFGEFNREVVAFDQIPPVLVDATTAVEDRTFWENSGFDPVGIMSAGLDAVRGRTRGASTITQQLVRQRLLNEEGTAETQVTASRKLKEIIQSIRVTQAFPGEAGKQRIMAAYLNQNYYGNESYGVAAAAKGYFGVELQDLTLAQAAILAALLQAPGRDDLVGNAIVECVDPAADPETCEETQLVVPADTKIVQRRNYILDQMAAGGTPLTGDAFGADDFAAAKAEKVVLAAQRSNEWKLPQFVRQVRRELVLRLCGEDAETCPGPGARWTRDRLDHRPRAPGDRREVGRRGGHRPPGEVAQGGRQGTGRPVRAVDGQPARQEAPQRGTDRHGLRDGRDRRVPGLGEPDGDQGDQAVPAPFRRPRRRLAPAGLRLQAGRVHDRHRRAAAHRGHDVHGCRDQLRRRLTPRPTPTTWSAGRSASATPSSSRSTSRP